MVPTVPPITTFTFLPDTAIEGRPSINPDKILSPLLFATFAVHVVEMFFEKYEGT